MSFRRDGLEEVTVSNKSPQLLKYQTTTDELLKKCIEVNFIFSIKIIDTEDQAEEESGLIKRKRGKEVSKGRIVKGKL